MEFWPCHGAFPASVSPMGDVTDATPGTSLLGPTCDVSCRVTLQDWVEQWWETTVHLRRSTRHFYEGLLRNYLLPKFGDRPLNRITSLDVKALVASLVGQGLSASRVRQTYRLLAMILAAAVEAEYLGRSPCTGIKVPRTPKKEMHILDPEQIERLAEAIAPPYGAFIYVLGYGGCRWGEATALRRENCDPLRSRLKIIESVSEIGGQLEFGLTKAYESRIVRLPRFVSERLAEHIGEHVEGDASALVFTAPDGGPLRYRTSADESGNRP